MRKINRLYDKADRITRGFTCNHKIAYSGCQGEILDNFWKIVKQKPLEFSIEDKLDEDKIRENYKAEARSLGYFRYVFWSTWVPFSTSLFFSVYSVDYL